MSEIKGKVVAITGASSGLGEVTARHLAVKGAKVMLGARRLEKLKNITDEINESGGTAVYMEMDVTDSGQVRLFAEKTVETFGKLDVLVNNAGIMSIAPLQALKVEEWDKMIDINIKGVLNGFAAALPIFEKQKSGHFVTLSSVAGLKVFSPGGTVYSATKFAVRAISEGFRHEVGEKIRTTTIAPGAVASELQYGTSHAASADLLNDFYKIAIPAASVARAIAFAIAQPSDVDVNEIALRPTVQEF